MMKVLFVEWNAYCKKDLLDTYGKLGHDVVSYPFNPTMGYRVDPNYEAALKAKIIEVSPDYVFTFNYYPVIAQVCNRENVPYVSWIYDSPFIPLYSYTTIFPCNYIFVFDKELCYEFQKNGIQTVHYLPMAANTTRLDAMNEFKAFANSPYANQTDISFVGSLYTEDARKGAYNHFPNLSDYGKGYLDGIMNAQKRVFGYNFIQEVMTPEIMKHLKASCPIEPNEDGVESEEYIFSQYYINRQITASERTELIQKIATHFPLDLYTTATDFSHPNVTMHDSVDYYNIVPYVYKCSKINLNMTLRSIKSGMPLRVFDIIGAGGFLLSNYQADFLDFFVPGEDFAFYDSPEDLIDKIGYYLAHEDERAQMAVSAHQKVQQAHTFLHRIQEMESYLP